MDLPGVPSQQKTCGLRGERFSYTEVSRESRVTHSAPPPTPGRGVGWREARAGRRRVSVMLSALIYDASKSGVLSFHSGQENRTLGKLFLELRAIKARGMKGKVSKQTRLAFSTPQSRSGLSPPPADLPLRSVPADLPSVRLGSAQVCQL